MQGIFAVGNRLKNIFKIIKIILDFLLFVCYIVLVRNEPLTNREMTMFFLRYTNDPELDKENKHSHDNSQYDIELDGLCGFSMKASSLEDAIEEANKDSQYRRKWAIGANRTFARCQYITIWEGDFAQSTIDDGDVFIGKLVWREVQGGELSYTPVVS